MHLVIEHFFQLPLQEDASKKSAQKSKFNLFALSSSKDKDKEEKKKSPLAIKNMAKGVGYSNYQQKGWDVKAYMAAQKEKDKQVGAFVKISISLGHDSCRVLSMIAALTGALELN